MEFVHLVVDKCRYSLSPIHRSLRFFRVFGHWRLHSERTKLFFVNNGKILATQWSRAVRSEKLTKIKFNQLRRTSGNLQCNYNGIRQK